MKHDVDSAVAQRAMLWAWREWGGSCSTRSVGTWDH